MSRGLRSLLPRGAQRGQASLEYVVVAAGLVSALFFVEFDGQTAAQYLAAAVRAFYKNLSFYLSLP